MEIKRTTKQRQHILTILEKNKKPMSINEIYLELVAVMPKIAKSTIYRNIDLLLSQNMIEKYYFDDNEIFYRLKSDTHEHKHYVICDQCKKVFDIPECPLHDFEKKMNDEGFIITNHQLQISGICKECKNRNAKKVQ